MGSQAVGLPKLARFASLIADKALSAERTAASRRKETSQPNARTSLVGTNRAVGYCFNDFGSGGARASPPT